jgi:aspartyl-tRNA(Asn)/glutamyl-tRNA(Gln) amidotransferase subunit A
MLAVMSRPEPRDAYLWPLPFDLPYDLADPDLTGLRIAVSPRLGCRAPLADAEVDAFVAQAGPLLAEAGAWVEEESPVWPVDPYEPFLVFWETGYAGTPGGYPPERRHLVDPLIRSAAARGLATDILTLHRAMRERTELAAASKDFFIRFDLLVGPVSPVPAYDAELDSAPGFDGEDWSWCPYTYPWNMTGQPAASVPIGFTSSGLPVGVQIIGRMGEGATILRAAAAIERRRPYDRKRPPLGSPA